MIEMKDSLLYKEPVEPAHWVGLKKSNDLLDYLRVRSGNIHPLSLKFWERHLYVKCEAEPSSQLALLGT